MSKHQEWKMLHLLFNNSSGSLTAQELNDAGVHCIPDSRDVLEDNDLVVNVGIEYRLTKAARKILSTFTLAQGPDAKVNIRVDYPEVFVVMPFSQAWSDDVFKMFDAGIRAAGFSVARGDTIVRVGDLSTNVWRSITQAGVIVADVSVANPNVYYEIGLADALGKPVYLFKQKGVVLPADFGGIHYYEYEPGNLQAGSDTLTRALTDWANHKDNRPFGVRAIVDRN